jgi:hypothetical protein
MTRRKGKRGGGRTVVVRPVESADSMIVRLRYPIRGTLAAVSTVIAKRWQPNGAYDVDPVLGSTSTPGFAEYAALYTYYRVTSFKVHAKFSNLDNLPYALYSVVSNTDPGTAGTNYYDFAQSAFGRTYELAPFYSGAGSTTHRQHINISKLVGMPIKQADSFRSVTTAIPADLVFWGVGLYSISGSNFLNGVAYDGYIEMRVKFYARQDQLLSFLKPTPVESEAQRQIFKIHAWKRLEDDLAKRIDPEKARKVFTSQVQELVEKELEKEKYQLSDEQEYEKRLRDLVQKQIVSDGDDPDVIRRLNEDPERARMDQKRRIDEMYDKYSQKRQEIRDPSIIGAFTSTKSGKAGLTTQKS